MITIVIVGTVDVAKNFLAMPAVVKSRLTTALHAIGVNFVAYVKSQKLSGQVLKNRSGTLRRSINYTFTDDGSDMYIDAGSRGLPYAAIHEHGGIIHIPEITPKNKRALHWVSGGADVFAMRAKAHDVRMPERSYLRSSLDELRPEITERLSKALEGLM